MVSLEQKLLFDLVHEFVDSAQPESMRSKACCKALAYLVKTLTDAEFESLKAKLSDQ